MGWSIGWDSSWQRDVGYGVPAWCDDPGCDRKIDRGLAYVCGGEPYGGEHGCGLYFCGNHMYVERVGSASEDEDEEDYVEMCLRCKNVEGPYDPRPDHPEWVAWKLTDDSWATWRAENPEEIARMRA